MFILKKGHQPGVYVPLRALFLVKIVSTQNCRYIVKKICVGIQNFKFACTKICGYLKVVGTCSQNFVGT